MPDTDRELLELAAKAAGIDLRWPTRKTDLSPRIWPGMDLWDPLTDDGDALRLAVALRLEISLSHDDRDRVFAEVKGRVCCGESFLSADRCAATRRAIVRAAAAMGQAMDGSDGRELMEGSDG